MKELLLNFIDIIGFLIFLVIYPIIIMVLLISEKSKLNKI
jgi:hypothetical protein